MSDAATMLQDLSEPWSSGEYVKSAIDRAAKLARLGYWRAFDIWYRKARKVEDYEIEQIASALQAKRERDARNEFHDIKIRLARLEASLSSRDENFHSPDIDFAREQMRGPGAAYRALDRK